MQPETLGIVKIFYNNKELTGSVVGSFELIIPKQTLLEKIKWHIRKMFKRKRYTVKFKIGSISQEDINGLRGI